MLGGLSVDQWINALAAFGQVAAAILAVIALPQSLEGRDPAEPYK